MQVQTNRDQQIASRAVISMPKIDLLFGLYLRARLKGQDFYFFRDFNA
jgi:hypothetical protein